MPAAVVLAIVLGSAGYGVAQAHGTAIKRTSLTPASRPMEVARGKVLNPAGKPASGVHIILEAWPPQSVFAHVKPGKHVPMRTAGSVVTNSTGHFTLRISAAAAARIKGAANPNGVLNLALRAASPKGWDWFGYSRTTKTRRANAIAPSYLPSWGAGHPETVTLRLSRTAANAPDFPVCPDVIDEGPLANGKNGLTPVTVGGTWTTLKRSTTWMTYGANQTTSMGIGIDNPLEGGGFTASGTIGVTSGLQETYNKVTGSHSRLYRTDFTYEEYNQCGFILTEPKSWAGGKLYQAVPALKHLTLCVPEGPGTSKVSSGIASTFKGGVSLKDIIGIDLSAETDYSSTATIFFKVNGNNTPAQLCGTTGYPGFPNPGSVQLEP
ncbi:MAG TPA: hypothetical protein VEV61_10315 [Streptosporangiaceae bacterium]|nr:hypothetical protein [Streptosporangiaceae bacterium]